MKTNLFYSGLAFETKDVVDSRLYIDGLTAQSLEQTFGANGKYAGGNIFTFNIQDDKFYKLTNVADPLNPNSWKKLTDSYVTFPEYTQGGEYTKGNCVMFTDSFNTVGFYIALGDLESGQSPESHPQLWFKISQPSEQGNGSGYRNTILHRLIPSDEQTHEVNIFFDKGDLPLGTSPNVECYVDFDMPQEGYQGWIRAMGSVMTWTTDSLIKVTVNFQGDMSGIKYDANNPNQKNVKLIIL